MWEVSVINKQKFLAELAKLLTFMYEDDRQRALGAYSEMFEEAEDEQALLQALVSPLRQAVEVARAYNSGKQSLSTEAKSREADAEHSEAFMETIYRIRAEALDVQAKDPVVDEDQISLFDAAEERRESTEPAEVPEESAEDAAPEEEEKAEDAQVEEAEAEDTAEEDAEEQEESEPVPVRSPAPAASVELPVRSMPQKTERKPRVLLLILFLIVAIPLGLIGTVLLLIPALASLAAAAACITVAVLAISSSLVSFPKIANLLVALGAALILLAVGLVFLMLFIWFLGGAIGGMINGLITLGSKWCYKEVPAE